MSEDTKIVRIHTDVLPMASYFID